jgi:predicted permease
MPQDLRYATRSLRRSRGFAAIVILTLGIGIGSTTAVYSVVDAILIQPLPFSGSDRLVRVAENLGSSNGVVLQRGVTHLQYLDWQARTRTLEDVAGFASMQAVVRTGEGTTRLWGLMTSGSMFSVLDTRAMLGRLLLTSDDADPDVVVLGFDAWRTVFHSDPAIVGSSIELERAQDMRVLTVVGVLPRTFEFPTGKVDFYTPFLLDDAATRYRNVTLLGRLRHGVTLRDAVQEANVIGPAIAPPPDARVRVAQRFNVEQLKERAVGELRPALRVLAAAAGVVLLIVCANVGNLLLARATARRREMAIRFALGATRTRIVRHVLAESTVLALTGAALGAGLAVAGVAVLKRLASVDAPGIFRFSFGDSILPRVNEIGLNTRMVAVALGIAIVASVVSSVPSALHLSRQADPASMKSRGDGASRSRSRMRAGLVVAQLLMATVLLVCAGVLFRSFDKLAAVDRGYAPAHALAFQLVLPPQYTIARRVDTVEGILSRLRTAPDVEAAGFSRAGMLIGEQITLGTFVPPGRTLAEMREKRGVSLRPVSPGFLTAMGVPVWQGRDLQTGDAASTPASIAISRSVAAQFGPGSHLGEIVRWDMEEHGTIDLRVIGIVSDLRNTSADREPYPEVFIDYRAFLALQQRWGESPLRQNERALGLLSFAVRTRGEPARAIPATTRIIHAVDPNAGIDSMIPVDRLVSSSVARPRFYAILCAVFAMVAALLAAVGVYGVLAYSVTRRTHEIGVRIALGAQRGQVLTLVLREGIVLAAVGVGAGVLAAAAGTRALRGMLYGVTPLDAPTFATVPLIFVAATMLASYLPARRATRVEPVIASRTE